MTGGQAAADRPADVKHNFTEEEAEIVTEAALRFLDETDHKTKADAIRWLLFYARRKGHG